MYRCIALLLFLLLASACSHQVRTSRTDHPPTTRKAQKPYTVNGERYEPLSSHEGFVQSGIASWYGSDFHGKKTSNGETYDMYAMTAAHKTLPLGVQVKVRNRDNDLEAIVRINDRGPFVAGRIIDLSFAAAKGLGIVISGTAPVKIEALGYIDRIDKGTTVYRPPASYDRGTFGIQVGAFGNIDNARKMAEVMKRRYGISSIRETVMDGTRYYRVRAGNYPSLKEAEQTRERSSDKEISAGYVVALD